MSILIKGMEMPEKCEVCWNCDRNFNNGDTLITDWMCLLEMRFVKGRGRPDWCPLVPIPPHGRLIDADAALRDGWTINRTYPASPTEMVYEAKAIDCLPTIIPAEEGER